jgi:hypothetical protein
MQHLQKVLPGSSPACRNRTPVIRHCRKNLEIRLQVFAQGHDTSDIPTPVAVVRRRPNGDDVLRGEVVFVAFVHQLVGARYQGEGVYVIKLESRSVREVESITHRAKYLSRDFVAKQPACASWRHGPGFHVLWITPYKIAEGAFMRDLLRSCDNAYLVERSNFG